MDLLSLLGRGDLASANSPDWFVSNNDPAPVSDRSLESTELRSHYFDRAAGFALRQSFSDTNNGMKS